MATPLSWYKGNTAYINNVPLKEGQILVDTQADMMYLDETVNTEVVRKTITHNELATASSFGRVKPDGTSITINNGVISSNGGRNAIEYHDYGITFDRYKVGEYVAKEYNVVTDTVDTVKYDEYELMIKTQLVFSNTPQSSDTNDTKYVALISVMDAMLASQNEWYGIDKYDVYISNVQHTVSGNDYFVYQKLPYSDTCLWFDNCDTNKLMYVLPNTSEVQALFANYLNNSDIKIFLRYHVGNNDATN